MTAAMDELSQKILSTLEASHVINVKILRKQVLIQMQTDPSDKAMKKSFKKIIQGFESEGKLSLDSDGTVTLKKSKKEKKDKKDKKKDKKRKKDKDDDDSQNPKKTKTNGDGEEGEEENHHSNVDENDVVEGSSDQIDKEKNVPCKGNPSGYTRLFLGNLPFAVDEASLREFFSPAIMTHVKWITDKETGKFYGSAFVEMKTSNDGAIAVTEKNGEKLMGRQIRINYAPSREGDIWPPKSKEMTGNGGQAGGIGIKSMSVKPENCMKLFIGNLSFDIDDDALIHFFQKVDAEVKAVRWLHHQDTGDFKGCGYVEFWNSEACDKAATLNGKSLLGRPIRIDWTD